MATLAAVTAIYGNAIPMWTPEEMAEILHDAETIATDPSLRVNSNDRHTRRPGHWEEMRLDQAAMIRAGLIYA